MEGWRGRRAGYCQWIRGAMGSFPALRGDSSRGQRYKALERRPDLDQRTIDAEVLALQQRLDLRQVRHAGQEPRGNLTREQPVPVLAEPGCIPDTVICRQADKRAEPRVVVELSHQQVFRSDRIECLRQPRPPRAFWRNRWPTYGRVQPLELRRQLGQGCIDKRADRPQRMIRQPPLLQAHVTEHPVRLPILAAHDPYYPGDPLGTESEFTPIVNPSFFQLRPILFATP